MRKLVLVFIMALLFCCGGQTTTTDGGTDGSTSCTGPSQCGAGAPICCASIVLSGGPAPACTASPITATCSASCPTTFVPNCSGTETVRICTQASDCSSDPANDKCCTFASGNQSLTFCASQSVATGAGATCL